MKYKFWMCFCPNPIQNLCKKEKNKKWIYLATTIITINLKAVKMKKNITCLVIEKKTDHVKET